MIGYDDMHGRIYWVWDPETGEIHRATAVIFDEVGAPKLPEKDDDLKHGVVFNETTVSEIEQLFPELITVNKTMQGEALEARPSDDTIEPEQPQPVPAKETVPIHPTGNGLPTPEPTPDPQDDRQSDEEFCDVEDFDEQDHEEYPDPTPVPLPRRSGRTTHVEGTYKALNKGEPPPGQRYLKDHQYTSLHLVEQRIKELQQFSFTAMKVEHSIALMSTQNTPPKNWWQARKLSNHDTWWLPAMEQQGNSLKDRGVYYLVPTPEGLDIYLENVSLMKRWTRIQAP